MPRRDFQIVWSLGEKGGSAMPHRGIHRIPAIHLLDMGPEKYGDCVLSLLGGKAILIDGAHPGDIRGRDGFPSIPDQLAKLLGPPPFQLDLLVVSHAHSDHVGCLPEMVDRGLLT